MFHPTLTRVWCRTGRRGQRLVLAPGVNETSYGFGIVAWVDGWVAGRLAPRRTAAMVCEQGRVAVERSQQRGRVALVLGDTLRPHTPAGAKLVRQLIDEVPDQLDLIATPASDPDAQRSAWLWRIRRRAVTHTQHRDTWATLLDDSRQHFQALAHQAEQGLRYLGSPFAKDTRPAPAELLIA